LEVDILIKNGYVVNGWGNPFFKADVAVSGDRIVKVGKLTDWKGEVEIDAKGLIVSPGFIDIHSHSDLTLLENPIAENKIRQGVTTDVNGNCGISVAPASKDKIDLLKELVSTVYGEEKYGIRWLSFQGYLDHLEDKGVGINVATLVGHSTIRLAVMGYEARASEKEELEEMINLLQQSLMEGAYGISTGLVYAPGSNATIEELITLCSVARRYGGIYATHMRGYRETFVEAVKEAIEIAEKASIPLQLSHQHTQYGGWGKSKEMVKLTESARKRGVDVTCDIHLDRYGGTPLRATLPPWVREGGEAKLVERLKNRDLREKIKRDMIEFIGPGTQGYIRHGRYELLHVIRAPTHQDLEGKNFAEIAKIRGVHPLDAILDVIIESKGQGIFVGGIYTPEEDIVTVLTQPICMVASDSWTFTSEDEPFYPSRFYGTFPRLIEKYVKKLRILTLEEAIRKITSFPAMRLGIWNRGLIMEGAKADIVIFDLKKIRDTAEEAPRPRGKHDWPEGIEYVLVNGKVAFENGELTGVLAGEVLRHQPPQRTSSS